MKLVFDCRYIRTDHHDGISRFSSELFAALAKRIEVTALISTPDQLRWLPQGTNYLLGSDPTNGFTELFVANQLNRFGATHVFSPMQTMGAFGRKYKLILTLHDLIYYKHPKPPSNLPLPVRIAWRIYHMNFWAARLLLNRADAVVTVSETSKQLILENRLTKRPVTVVYNSSSSDSDIHSGDSRLSESGRKTLVYMGSFMGYKNVECLVKGMKELPGFELLLLSKISNKRKEQLLQHAGQAAARIEFLNGVSDHRYLEILSSAFALVSASRDEGFGIPLVEAMKRSIPLVVSDIPIFREVAKDAAFYFDPSSAESFANAVKLLASGDNWLKQSYAAQNRSRTFDWEASATALLAAINQS